MFLITHSYGLQNFDLHGWQGFQPISIFDAHSLNLVECWEQSQPLCHHPGSQAHPSLFQDGYPINRTIIVLLFIYLFIIIIILR